MFKADQTQLKGELVHWKTGQKKISRMKKKQSKIQKKGRYRRGTKQHWNTVRRNKISIIGTPGDERISQK